MKKAAFICALFALDSACANKGPNHIGNPLLLPGHAIINSIENAAYGARRGRVKTYVSQNLWALYSDIDNGGGPALREVMDIANVTPPKMPQLLNDLQSHPEIYRKADIEPLIVAIMVHSD